MIYGTNLTMVIQVLFICRAYFLTFAVKQYAFMNVNLR